MLQNEELWDAVVGIYIMTGINVKLDTKAKTKMMSNIDKINYVHLEDVSIQQTNKRQTESDFSGFRAHKESWIVVLIDHN